MPERTEDTYKILQKTIPVDDIIIVDNGSDKAPIPKNTKIRIKKNIKAPGAWREAFNYSIKNKIDYPIIITTSGKLIEDFNYKQGIEKTLTDKSNSKFGILYAGYNSASNILPGDISRHQYQVQEYIPDPSYAQAIFSIWSLDFIKLCKKTSTGYFNENFIHGHGVGEDWRMLCLKEGFMEWTTPHIIFHWDRNSVYVSGRAEISREEYFAKNKAEFKKELQRKYNMSMKEINNFLLSHRRINSE